MLALYLSLLDSAEEKQKFTLIYELYAKMMVSVAYELCGDQGLAEDAAHDAFLFIARHFDRVDEADSAQTRAYLRLLAQSKTIDLLRRRKEVVDSELVRAVSDREAAPTVEADFFEKFDAERVRQQILLLSDDYQTPLMLYYVKDLTCAQIGAVMGLQAATVRKRLDRARAALAQLMRADDEPKQKETES